MNATRIFLLTATFCTVARSPAAAVPEELVDIMGAAVLYLDFESGDFLPEIGDVTVLEKQPVEIVRLAEGNALGTENGGRLSFRAGEGPDFSRPGSLSFWVSPRGWDWGNDRPYNAFCQVSWKEGTLAVTRQGLMHPPGEAVKRLDRILLYARTSSESQPLRVSLGPSDSKRWADGTWHLVVLTWNGPTWSISLDGGVRKYFSPTLPMEEKAQFKLGGTQERTCFKALTVFHRELSDAAIATLYRLQEPRP